MFNRVLFVGRGIPVKMIVQKLKVVSKRRYIFKVHQCKRVFMIVGVAIVASE
jgi:hypothetical protein